MTLNPDFCLLWYCETCHASGSVDRRPVADMGIAITVITEHINASPECNAQPTVLEPYGWYKAVKDGDAPQPSPGDASPDNDAQQQP